MGIVGWRIARDDWADMKKASRNKFPKGWDEKKVRQVLRHCETQSEEAAAAEDDAAYEERGYTMMAVPVELVPAVQKLIGKKVG